MVHHQALPVQIGKETEKTTRKKVYDLIFLIPPSHSLPSYIVRTKNINHQTHQITIIVLEISALALSRLCITNPLKESSAAYFYHS